MENSTYSTHSAPIFNEIGEETYEKRYASAQNKGLEPCTICGRGVAEGKGFLVMGINGGDFLAADQWEAWEADTNADHAGDMGYWILGSECGKKIPADYRKQA
jgi:hypothetical protein